MPKLYDYRLFISHAWKYGDDYNKLISFLDKATYFSYYNYSAPIEKPLFPAGTPMTNSEIQELISAKFDLVKLLSCFPECTLHTAIGWSTRLMNLYEWGNRFLRYYLGDNKESLLILLCMPTKLSVGTLTQLLVLSVH